MRISYFVRHLPRAFSKGLFCTVVRIVALDCFNKAICLYLRQVSKVFAEMH